MAEESQFCPWCGAVMRPKAVFCHSCGHSLAEFEGATVGAETQDLQHAEALSADGETVLTETPTIVRTANAETTNGSSAPTVKELLSNQTADGDANENTAVDKPAQPKKLRKTKRYVNRTEYVWEEADAPTWSVLVFSVAAFVLVLLLFWLSNFWR